MEEDGFIHARELGKKMKAISIAEFFEKNKHLLGYSNPQKALIMMVKEAVDNSLDACEEARILPEIYVSVTQASPDIYRVIVRDNGPGILPEKVPKVFGKFLYGSKFHVIKQSRGQQGMGISSAVLYAQLTTGEPAKVITKTGKEEPAYEFRIMIDVTKNEPRILSKRKLEKWIYDHGTEIELKAKGSYVENKRQSILSYLQHISIVTPYATIIFVNPKGNVVKFERVTKKMPEPPKEMKPHPYGIEIGFLERILAKTKCRKIKAFLIKEFSRIGEKTATEILKVAGIPPDRNPKSLTKEEIKNLYLAMQQVKVPAPPTTSLSPIGETLFKIGIKRLYGKADFVEAITRPPSVYSGHPFQVEVGVAYGGEIDTGGNAIIMRYANKVPLLYNQHGCLITKVISSIDWRRYGINQPGGQGIPQDNIIFFAHVVSTNVPYVSESKEAIADVPEIENELKIAFQELGRLLRLHISKKKKLKKIAEKKEIINRILPEIAKKASSMLNKPVPPLEPVIAKIMNNYLFESEVKYDKKSGEYEVSIKVMNYTRISRKFKVYVRIPKEAEIIWASPEPYSVEGNYVIFEMPKMSIHEERELILKFRGVEEGAYDEAEIFVEGIEPEFLVGAESLEESDYLEGEGE